tara:strand:- start:5066 stop:5686 length:621 start_codon:yes stop_codon:yes gene_type:complete
MNKKVCILDYGLGNILSLKNSLNYLGHNNFLISEEKNKSFDCLIIPGVGSFSQAINLIKKKNLKNFIDLGVKNNSLILGICLGMQILFKKGYENGETPGLNYFEGEVKKMSGKTIKKLPHIGWSETNFSKNEENLFNKYSGEKFYYIHSFECKTSNNKDTLANSKYYEHKFVAAVKKKNLIGFQFHPEKSGEVGLNLLNDVLNNYS